MKRVKVKIITAKGCKSCEDAKKLIQKAAENSGVEVTMIELDSETKEAESLALTYQLERVPSFVINGHGFAGARHKVEKVREALTWGK